MSLLDIDKLTIRFGGLTAVDRLDLHVEEGQIFSVIGPNGAGKTTLFNGITALCRTAGGAIRYRGRDLRRSFTLGIAALCASVGLAVGVASAIVAIDVNSLWKVVVKENSADLSRPFPLLEAWKDLRAYFQGEPRVEPRRKRWHVVTHDSSRSLGSAPTREGAVLKLHDLAGSGFVRPPVARTFRSAFLWGFLVGAAAAFSFWWQTRRTSHRVASKGIARTFQNVRLFPDMTAMENVMVGMERRLSPGGGRWRRWSLPAALAAGTLLASLGILPAGSGILLALAATGYLIAIHWIGAFSLPDRAVEREAQRRAAELLAFVGLEGRGEVRAESLPYGDERRLEIARALATRPHLLLLDEPAAGMNPAEALDLMGLIRRIRDSGVTVLLIEHHMKVVMGISDRIAVLDYGSKIAEGTPEEVRANPAVIEAYLGKEEVR